MPRTKTDDAGNPWAQTPSEPVHPFVSAALAFIDEVMPEATPLHKVELAAGILMDLTARLKNGHGPA